MYLLNTKTRKLHIDGYCHYIIAECKEFSSEKAVDDAGEKYIMCKTCQKVRDQKMKEQKLKEAK